MSLTYFHKTIVWRELYTKDAAKAKAFYTGLFGWQFQTMPMEKGDYYIASLGTTMIGGMMDSSCGDMPPEVPSYWSSYVSVPSVDDCCAKATAKGARILFGPMDVPNVGRMASFMDPQGAVLCVFTSAKGDMPSDKPLVGTFCWESLSSTDPAASKAFYTNVIGWVAKPFPGGGDHFTVFAPNAEHPYGVASMNPTPPGVPSHWATNAYIDDLKAYNDKVRRLGGTVMVELIPIPGIGKCSVVSDPTGAAFCLFEPDMKV